MPGLRQGSLALGVGEWAPGRGYGSQFCGSKCSICSMQLEWVSLRGTDSHDPNSGEIGKGEGQFMILQRETASSENGDIYV